MTTVKTRRSFYTEMTDKEKKAQDTATVIKSMKSETVVEWTEDLKTPKSKYHWFVFDADKFTAWYKSILPLKLAELPYDKTLSVGDLFFRYFQMPIVSSRYWGAFLPRYYGEERASISMGPRRGRCSFNKPVYIPQLVKSKDAYDQDNVWMSLTPMEILTQRPGLTKARGHVLIGGLGLGWFARRCCERDKVKSVTVVEINKAVAETFKFDHPKLNIIVADVWKTDISKYDSVLLDVFESHGGAYCNSKVQAMKEKHKNVWAWGDVYGAD